MTDSLTWPEVLSALVSGTDLDAAQARWAMNQILLGEATPAQIGGFMVALRAKGESAAEVNALVQAMLDRAVPLELPQEAVDVVGSGGDRSHTVNISTMAALVAAAAGAIVVKHGNRAASSRCGTADVLEELGVRLDVPPEAQTHLLAETGITFLFAPLYHGALRYVAAPRRELGIQTTFNFLGPLANPAKPAANAIGVADPRIAVLVADVLAARGSRGLVFHGSDGLDELTTTTTSTVWLINDGQVVEQVLDPTALGLQPATRQDLQGGDPSVNAGVVRDLVGGAAGPVRDIVVLNAGAALLAFHGPEPHADIIEQLGPHLEAAQAALDSGAAASLLERWRVASQSA